MENQNEFETILLERNVVENLNRLEDLILDAKKRKARSTASDEDPSSVPVPYVSTSSHPSPSTLLVFKARGSLLLMNQTGRPHTLPPTPLISAHLNPLHRSQQSQLNAKLQTTQSQNATLIETIRRQRTEIEELVKMAEMVVGDLEDAGGRLGSVGEELAREGRGAEEILGSF
jgi:kinetochore protein NNF1